MGESIICSELNLSIREIANITIDISKTVGFDNIAFNIQSDKSCDDYQNFCVESLDSENIQCHGDARDSLYASIKGYINYMHDRSNKKFEDERIDAVKQMRADKELKGLTNKWMIASDNTNTATILAGWGDQLLNILLT